MTDAFLDSMIAVKGLNFVGKHGTSFKEISFSIKKGGVHGILSPFGSDSSVLLGILLGVLVPDSAEIALDGETIDVSLADWKKKVGYVPKTPDFYDKMTVSEVLEFVGEVRGISTDLCVRQTVEAISLLDLQSIENRLVGRLSLEEKKRLSLAAALMGNPSILLFDAPTPEFFDWIRMLGNHKTVVLGGGDLSVMKELCEDVVILSEGTLVVSGTFSELESALSTKEKKQSLAEVFGALEALSKEKGRSSIFQGEEKRR